MNLYHYLLIGLVIILIAGALMHILSTAKKFKLSDEQLKAIKKREAEQRKKDKELDQ